MAEKNKIEIILSAVDQGLTTGLNRAAVSVKGFFAKLTSVKTLMAAIATGAGAGFVTKAFDTAGALVDQSDKLGISTTKLQEYQHAAAMSGVANDSLNTALTKFSKGTAEAYQGTGDLLKIMNAYGISVKNADGSMRSIEDVFADYSDLVMGLKDPQEKVRVAMAAFGKAGAEMIPMLISGRAGLKDYAKEANALGLVMDENLLRTAEETGDKMETVGKVVSTILTAAVIELAPEISKLASGFLDWVKANKDLISQKVPEYIDDVADVLGKIWAFIEKEPAVLEFGLIGLAVGGRKGAALGAGIGHMAEWASNLGAALGIASTGAVDFSKVATANFEELQQLVDDFDNGLAGHGAISFRGKVPKDPSKEDKPSQTPGSIDTIIAPDDTAAKAAAKKIQSVNDSIVESTRKAHAEIAGLGKSAYQKRMAEIESEANKYLAAGADKVKVADWVAAETTLAYQSEIAEQKKVTAERLRATSQERILALEKEKIAASTLPSELDRAEAELDIDRRIMEERVALKREELVAIKAETTASQADIIQAESELAEILISNEIALSDRLRDISSKRMDDMELSWRRGIASAEEYQIAVQNALESGAISKEQADERLIASGDDMGAAFSFGMQRARESMQTDAEMMMYIGENLNDQIANGVGSAWSSFISGTKSAGEAMRDFAVDTLNWISQIILKQMILNALQSMGGAFSSGGSVSMSGADSTAGTLNFADGGRIPGSSPNPRADNIPAWLTAGEFVHPVRAVKYYGLPFMEAIRRLQFPNHIAHALAGGTLPRIPSGYRLADGGVAAGHTTTVKTGDTKLRVVNVLDRNLVGDYMRSADGEMIFINMIRKNGSTIQKLIGR